MINGLKKSIMAGMMISLGCVAFLQSTNNVIGALLFSLGLLSICAMGLKLYTGAVGYLTFDDYDLYRPNASTLLYILIGNIIGCAIIAVLSYGFVDVDRARMMVDIKLDMNPFVFFKKSILCGIFMFVGVHCYKKSSVLGPFAIILAVMGFILAGFEHCIADTYYFLVCGKWIELPVVLLTAIIGNAIGAILAYQLTDSEGFGLD